MYAVFINVEFNIQRSCALLLDTKQQLPSSPLCEQAAIYLNPMAQASGIDESAFEWVAAAAPGGRKRVVRAGWSRAAPSASASSASGAVGVRSERPVIDESFIERSGFLRESLTDFATQPHAGLEQTIRIDIVAGFPCKIDFGGQRQRLRHESRVASGFLQQGAKRMDKPLRIRLWSPVAGCGNARKDRP